MIDEETLIRMTVAEAREIKWMLGAEKYGPKFIGDPVVKLHSEGIDCLNYTEELAKRDIARAYELSDLQWHADKIIQITRSIYARGAASG